MRQMRPNEATVRSVVGHSEVSSGPQWCHSGETVGEKARTRTTGMHQGSAPPHTPTTPGTPTTTGTTGHTDTRTLRPVSVVHQASFGYSQEINIPFWSELPLFDTTMTPQHDTTRDTTVTSLQFCQIWPCLRLGFQKKCQNGQNPGKSRKTVKMTKIPENHENHWNFMIFSETPALNAGLFSKKLNRNIYILLIFTDFHRF